MNLMDHRRRIPFAHGVPKNAVFSNLMNTAIVGSGEPHTEWENASTCVDVF